MAQIQIDGLRKTFRKSGSAVKAVDNLTLQVEDQEFLVLVGPSGCGKTTTLKILAGIEQPDEGPIRLAGQDITHSETKDRNIALCFQHFALYRQLTVYENLEFGLTLIGIPSRERRQRIVDVAEKTQVSNLLNRKPEQLSGGQKQRVALARTLVRRPAIILLDEPLSNLDAQLRNTMRTELRLLHQTYGTTSICVTHDQAEAMSIADRIAVMEAGKLRQVAPPAELYNEPQHCFVAAFIGAPASNILAGTCHHGHLTCIFGDYPCAYDPSQEGKPLTLSIKPEQLQLVAASNCPALVEMVENLGDENLIHLKTPNGHEKLIVKTRNTIRPLKGSLAHVAATASEIKVFDNQTGQRLPLQCG